MSNANNGDSLEDKLVKLNDLMSYYAFYVRPKADIAIERYPVFHLVGQWDLIYQYFSEMLHDFGSGIRAKPLGNKRKAVIEKFFKKILPKKWSEYDRFWKTQDLLGKKSLGDESVLMVFLQTEICGAFLAGAPRQFFEIRWRGDAATREDRLNYIAIQIANNDIRKGMLKKFQDLEKQRREEQDKKAARALLPRARAVAGDEVEYDREFFVVSITPSLIGVAWQRGNSGVDHWAVPADLRLTGAKSAGVPMYQIDDGVKYTDAAKRTIGRKLRAAVAQPGGLGGGHEEGLPQEDTQDIFSRAITEIKENVQVLIERASSAGSWVPRIIERVKAKLEGLRVLSPAIVVAWLNPRIREIVESSDDAESGVQELAAAPPASMQYTAALGPDSLDAEMGHNSLPLPPALRRTDTGVAKHSDSLEDRNLSIKLKSIIDLYKKISREESKKLYRQLKTDTDASERRESNSALSNQQEHMDGNLIVLIKLLEINRVLKDSLEDEKSGVAVETIGNSRSVAGTISDAMAFGVGRGSTGLDHGGNLGIFNKSRRLAFDAVGVGDDGQPLPKQPVESVDGVKTPLGQLGTTTTLGRLFDQKCIRGGEVRKLVNDESGVEVKKPNNHYFPQELEAWKNTGVAFIFNPPTSEGGGGGGGGGEAQATNDIKFNNKQQAWDGGKVIVYIKGGAEETHDGGSRNRFLIPRLYFNGGWSTISDITIGVPHIAKKYGADQSYIETDVDGRPIPLIIAMLLKSLGDPLQVLTLNYNKCPKVKELLPEEDQAKINSFITGDGNAYSFASAQGDVPCFQLLHRTLRGSFPGIDDNAVYERQEKYKKDQALKRIEESKISVLARLHGVATLKKYFDNDIKKNVFGKKKKKSELVNYLFKRKEKDNIMSQITELQDLSTSKRILYRRGESVNDLYKKLEDVFTQKLLEKLNDEELVATAAFHFLKSILPDVFQEDDTIKDALQRKVPAQQKSNTIQAMMEAILLGENPITITDANLSKNLQSAGPAKVAGGDIGRNLKNLYDKLMEEVKDEPTNIINKLFDKLRKQIGLPHSDIISKSMCNVIELFTYVRIAFAAPSIFPRGSYTYQRQMVPSDGHCLFRSIWDSLDEDERAALDVNAIAVAATQQLEERGGDRGPWVLRALAAQQMRMDSADQAGVVAAMVLEHLGDVARDQVLREFPDGEGEDGGGEGGGEEDVFRLRASTDGAYIAMYETFSSLDQALLRALNETDAIREWITMDRPAAATNAIRALRRNFDNEISRLCCPKNLDTVPPPKRLRELRQRYLRFLETDPTFYGGEREIEALYRAMVRVLDNPRPIIVFGPLLSELEKKMEYPDPPAPADELELARNAICVILSRVHYDRLELVAEAQAANVMVDNNEDDDTTGSNTPMAPPVGTLPPPLSAAMDAMRAAAGPAPPRREAPPSAAMDAMRAAPVAVAGWKRKTDDSRTSASQSQRDSRRSSRARTSASQSQRD